ncbi:unnamed protein product [Phytophthora lilii]|uniref:Unnamed protein product n=1 Tax=Phytophthora lilii TaxID=2077276 RepID=A0A9W6WUS3_9STRA|nr:unnamed protein product [Phytophthora lilii]
MHSRQELAVATSAQVEIMKEQLGVTKEKVAALASHQKIMHDQAGMKVMCTVTEGLSDIGKEYILLKQKQILVKAEGAKLTYINDPLARRSRVDMLD